MVWILTRFQYFLIFLVIFIIGLDKWSGPTYIAMAPLSNFYKRTYNFSCKKAIIMMRINLTIFTLIVFGSVEPRYLDNTTEKSDVSLHIF